MSHPPLPEGASQAERVVQEEVAEDPTIPPLVRKRKGKEVVETVAKKAKVSTPLLIGGALRIGGEGENPPPVVEEGGGAGSAAPAFRPAAEAGQAPPASPLLVPIERSAQRAAERSAPPSRVLEPSAEKSTPVAGTSSGDRKTKLVLRRGR